MQVGLIGLGTMGRGMALRLADAGHDVIGYDLDPQTHGLARENGATVVKSVAELIDHLDMPRIIWLMLPPGSVTTEVISALMERLRSGDLVIDGGNNDFRVASEHKKLLSDNGVSFADVGVSGGKWGWKNGYGLMVGASAFDFQRISPLLEALSADGGYKHVGEVGSGHLVKAIHNGVQYGILEAYAEGYALLDAHPEVDSLAALSAWQEGSSVRSWLLEQIIAALDENPDLSNLDSRVSDSGMGRWVAEEAVRLAVPTPVLTTALFARFASRSDGISNKLLVAARSQIGGQKK